MNLVEMHVDYWTNGQTTGEENFALYSYLEVPEIAILWERIEFGASHSCDHSDKGVSDRSVLDGA